MADAPITYNYEDAPEVYSPPSDNAPEVYHPPDIEKSENDAAAASAPTRLRDRRVCGFPFLGIVALLAFLLVAAIVGGTVGGGLGSRRDDTAAAVAEGTSTTTTSMSSSTAASTSTSGTATPTSTGVFVPDLNSWYYIKNDRFDPSTTLIYRNHWSEADQEAYWTIDDQFRGDAFEQWAFWPAKRNSTLAEQYRQQAGITVDLYVVYNRGLMQLPDTTAPSQETLDRTTSWWWFEPHELPGYHYCKGAWVGPEFAFTVLNTREWGSVEDHYNFAWNRTSAESYETPQLAERFRIGQAWKIEFAFAFVEEEKGLWDLPPGL